MSDAQESLADGVASSDDDDPANPEEAGWTSFKKGGKKYVTIRQGEAIGPNSTVVEEHLSDSGAVQLYYHEDQNQVGIEPISEYDPTDDRLYKINPDSSGSVTINARAFMKHHDIQHDQTVRYTPEWDEDFGLLVVDLEQEGEVVESSD